MTFQPCRIALAFAVIVSALLAPWPASGQTYPTQPIKFIIPATAGGLPDTVARIVGRRLQERLGQSVVVENRPGGNGSVSVAALASLPADGHAFIIQDGSIVAINPHLYANLSYKADDLLPVVLIARAPLFLAANSKVPVDTLKAFVDYAKANPGKLNYGSSGVGSTHHLTMEALQSSLQLKLTHVPYKGTGESIPALLGGHIDVVFSAYPSLSGAVGSKSVKLLATNGGERSPQAPDVPPVADLIPGFDFAPIIGIYARAGSPPAAVLKIADDVAMLVKEPEIIRQFGAAGIEAVGAGPADYGRQLKSLSERVGKAVQAAGIKAQ